MILVAALASTPMASRSDAPAQHADTVTAPARLPTTLVNPTLEGRHVRVSDLSYPDPERPRKPRATLVMNFMASWCAPCLQELPQLIETCRAYQSQGVQLWLVSVDSFDTHGDLRRILDRYGVGLDRVLLDPYLRTAQKLGVASNDRATVPRTFVVSREGAVLGSYGAFTTATAWAQLKTDIERALAPAEASLAEPAPAVAGTGSPAATGNN